MNRANANRCWYLSTALLLLAAMSIAADRLVATDWTSNLGITQTIAFFGVIAGLFLGKSQFKAFTATILGILYGLFLISWQLGITINQEILWSERISILTSRSGVVIYQLVNHEAIKDSILFLIMMGVLYWFLSSYAGFSLVRDGNAWKAILPGGIAILIIHIFDFYVSGRSWYLAAYIFFSLLLLSRVTFLKQQKEWRENQTALPPHISIDIIRFTIFATFMVILLAWTIPTAANALPAAQQAWEPVRKAWVNARDEFDFAFASLRSNVTFVGEYYGISTSLGRGTPLTDALIFTAQAPNNLPPSSRLYWRARVYEYYENGNWSSAIQDTHRFNHEEDDLNIQKFSGRWMGSFRITSSVPLNTLFTPAQPMWVNRSGQVIYAETPDGSVDISAFLPAPSLEAGQEYRVQSAITYTSIELLRAAGTDYPTWISDHYLNLPDSITSRTYQLAQEITLGLENPYDQAVAITDYLRENITYVETIEDDIPLNRERIDWFLFDYQKGFCNYYSTAEIVLLRAIDIPARWAVGYAQGERLADEQEIPGTFFESGAYVVRQHHTHAWVEVYFPEIGWVEFEPTSSQPEIIRLESLPQEDKSSEEPDTLFPDNDRERYQNDLDRLREERDLLMDSSESDNSIPIIYWFIPAIALVFLVIFAWKQRQRLTWHAMPIMIETTLQKAGLKTPAIIKQWAQRARLDPLTKAYHEVNLALDRLGYAPAITETPLERGKRLANLLPTCVDATEDLINQYHQEVYGNHAANLVVILSSAKQIKIESIKENINTIFNIHKNPFKKFLQRLK